MLFPEPNIYITESAQHTILDALKTSGENKLEHGGSLLACEATSPTLIVVAVPTGPGADQGYSHLQTDAAYQNRAINQVRQHLPGLSYVGDWHIHPMHLPHLSWVDLDTAKKILEESEPKREHLDLLLATPGRNNEALLVGFRVSNLAQHGTIFHTLRLVVLPDDDAVVVQRLGRTLPTLDQLLAPTITAVPQVSSLSITRIETELAEIRTGLQATATLLITGDGLMAAHIVRGQQEIEVLFPPEYPLGAPLVFMGRLDSGPLKPVILKYGWSSIHRLLDVVLEGLNTQPSLFFWPSRWFQKPQSPVLTPKTHQENFHDDDH